jgi:hypothetical protein
MNRMPFGKILFTLQSRLKTRRDDSCFVVYFPGNRKNDQLYLPEGTR